MEYFVTGGTGFIGHFLIGRLLERGGTVYALTRAASTHKLDKLRERYGVSSERLVAIGGDLLEPGLGIGEADLDRLRGRIDHFFHLAAVYDMAASPESQQQANVEGTRHAVRAAEEIAAKRFHHMSSVAAGGLYRGVFREDMFDEAEALIHPYFRTKHDSEGIVRKECRIPWRVYRPSVVVGHSQTGEIDKIDGPYYFFSLLKKLRNALPPWVPLVGVEGGTFNVVPVDFVVAAMDHIAHQEELDVQCFHLTNPYHLSMGELINVFAEVANAPKMALRFETRIFNFIPAGILDTLSKLPPIKRIRASIFKDLGMPEETSIFLNYPTHFDCRETERVLKGTGIEVPRLREYVGTLWDYWERNLDPDLFIDHSLQGNVAGRIAVVTGASSGIGKHTAIRLAAAGAEVILAARTLEKLQDTQREIELAGGIAHVEPCDVSDFDSCDAFVERVLAKYGHVDILINNAGRSIRRSIDLSFDRFHDFQRIMQLNYFGSLRLILGFLPSMSERRQGHVINISTIGVFANSPRFSAYIASKSALDAFSRCAAAEFSDRHVHFTCVAMPLVRTPMISPTKVYEYAPALTVDEAVNMVVDAIVEKQKVVRTTMGLFLQVTGALFPKVLEIMMNASFRMFPDSRAAKGKVDDGRKPELSSEQVAFAAMMKGVHF